MVLFFSFLVLLLPLLLLPLPWHFCLVTTILNQGSVQV